ncbi:MAG: RNA polymerase sigma factor [Myxococcales bacterium]|nr:RNA polymerase sigma factor [Myxococcales bacterium]
MSARIHRVRPPTPDPEDPATLRGAAAGDEACVRAFYRGHIDRVHRHVARVLGRHDPDVEDVVQKVFLAAFDGAEGFGERAKVSSWLMGIATRRALDEARSRWRRDRWSRLGERLGHLVGVGRAPSAPDASSTQRSEAEALLQVLTPEQRTVFVLKEVEGHTLQEIADMTGVGISTLHARLQAARKRLDAAIEGACHA